MALLPGVLLVLSLAALAWFTRNDAAQYAAFKALTETRDRQKRFRIWLAKSFLIFFIGAAAALTALGRLVDVLREPVEFSSLSRQLHISVPPDVMTTLMPGFVAGAVIGILGLAIITRVAARRGGKAVVMGDIEPLMPRNRAETFWVFLISLNAGVSEELFFRLLLPLLIVLITGNVWVAFLGAGIIFGLVHFYQGWTGILATAVAGLVFAGIYLWTASLLVAMAVHALMDISSLVVRPALMRRAAPG